MTLEELVGPATLAACTLLAICALDEGVQSPGDVHARAVAALDAAYLDAYAAGWQSSDDS